MNPEFVAYVGLNVLSITFCIYFLFRLFAVSFANQIVSTSYKYLEPVLKTFRLVFPIFYRIDLSCLFVIIAIKVFSFFVYFSKDNLDFSFIDILIWSCFSLLLTISLIFRYSLLVSIIGSWAFPGSRNPFLMMCGSISNVLLKPFQRFTVFNGIDFSPILVFFLLIQFDNIIFNLKFYLDLPSLI